jgi:hypothetical protein
MATFQFHNIDFADTDWPIAITLNSLRWFRTCDCSVFQLRSPTVRLNKNLENVSYWKRPGLHFTVETTIVLLLLLLLLSLLLLFIITFLQEYYAGIYHAVRLAIL